MIYRYPPEVHEFVKKWAPKLRDKDLAEACNKELGTSFTASGMKSFRGNHGYRNGKKQWTSEEYWKYQTYYPQGLYEFIRDNSWHVPSKDMARMVNEKFGTNFTATAMKQFRQRHGIKSGCTGWFQKGRSPGNKGKKQSEFCSPEAIEASRRTQFKKGHRPKNELPVGSVTKNKEGDLLIKISDEGTQWERWQFLSRYTWEQHNGPIPEGMCITFKDGDRNNCSIDNLMMLTKAENASLNGYRYRSKDPQITECGLQLVRLRNAAKKKKKGESR